MPKINYFYISFSLNLRCYGKLSIMMDQATVSMKENFYSRNTRIKLKIKADSNRRRNFIPMVVSAASGFIFWRCFVFKPVSNRFKNRRTAPLGSYYPMVVKNTNLVSELKNILPVLTNYISSESIINKEIYKTRYHFFPSAGIIYKRHGN